MIDYFKNSLNKYAVLIALVSFTIGSLLMLLFLAFQGELLIGVGMLFVALSYLVNGIVLLFVLVNAMVNYSAFKENMTTIFILLANVPISMLYLFIVIEF